MSKSKKSKRAAADSLDVLRSDIALLAGQLRVAQKRQDDLEVRLFGPPDGKVTANSTGHMAMHQRIEDFMRNQESAVTYLPSVELAGKRRWW